MNIKKIATDNLNAQLCIKIEAADYQPQIEEVFANYRRTANMPGFRKGKVPMAMIRKMYGKGVIAEQVNKLIQEKIAEYLDKEHMEILGDPIPDGDNEHIDWSEGNDFEFSFAVGLSPEFEVKITKNDKLPLYKIKVDDAAIDHQIEGLTRSYGSVDNVDKSEEGDTLFGKFTSAAEGGPGNEAVLDISLISNADIQKLFIGIGPDDVVEFDMLKALDSNLIESTTPNLPKEKITEENRDWNFTVIRVTRLVPAELNQELFDKVFGEGNVNGLEEFRAKVAGNIEKMHQQRSDRQLLNDATEYILDKTKFDLPDAFLKRWLKTVSEQPLTDDQIEAEYAQYELSTRWQLIRNRIARNNEIQVTREELVGFAENKVRQQMLQHYDISEPDEKMVKKRAQEILENEEDGKWISNDIFSRKLVAFFKESFELNEQEVTHDQFMEKATK